MRRPRRTANAQSSGGHEVNVASATTSESRPSAALPTFLAGNGRLFTRHALGIPVSFHRQKCKDHSNEGYPITPRSPTSFARRPLHHLPSLPEAVELRFRPPTKITSRAAQGHFNCRWSRKGENLFRQSPPPFAARQANCFAPQVTPPSLYHTTPQENRNDDARSSETNG